MKTTWTHLSVFFSASSGHRSTMPTELQSSLLLTLRTWTPENTLRPEDKQKSEDEQRPEDSLRPQDTQELRIDRDFKTDT